MNVSYRDHIINKEIRKRIIVAFGSHDNLLNTVKKIRAMRCGHVTRSSGQAKIILQGTVPGRRWRDRQKKRWEDNIPEYTGQSFIELQSSAYDQDRWWVITRAIRLMMTMMMTMMMMVIIISSKKRSIILQV